MMCGTEVASDGCLSMMDCCVNGSIIVDGEAWWLGAPCMERELSCWIFDWTYEESTTLGPTYWGSKEGGNCGGEHA